MTMDKNVKVYGVFNRRGLVSLHKTRSSANTFANDEAHAHTTPLDDRMFAVDEIELKP